MCYSLSYVERHWRDRLFLFAFVLPSMYSSVVLCLEYRKCSLTTHGVSGDQNDVGNIGD